MKGLMFAAGQQLSVFLKKFVKKQCLPLVALGLMVIAWDPLKAQAQEQVVRLVEANRAFEQQDFAHAVRLYESLLQEGYKNGHLYYNLGNAYFRRNDLGQAIGNYLKAAHYLPRNEDLRANLNYARSQTKDQKAAPPQQTFRLVLQKWSNPLTLQEWLGLLLVFNGIFWGVGLLRLFYGQEIFSWVMFLAGGLALFVAVGAASRWLAPVTLGTVLPPQSAIYSAPHKNSTILFELHAGTEVIVEEAAPQWAKIQFEPTRQGWIQKKNLLLIEPIP